ncbi:HGxxPAAW family protein, partial [Staphylococcus aureus]|nr:HGxxPAAW family protein [Staphylococcus aureus]
MSNEDVVFSKYHVEDEGTSVAGWTGFTLIVLGFIIGTVGLFLAVDVVVWVGVAVVAVGAIAWMILGAM